MTIAELQDYCVKVPRSLGYIEQQEFIRNNKDKTVIFDLGPGYAKHEYQVMCNGANLTMDEIAYFCDGGNLCFGYRLSGNKIIVHTD